MTACQKSTLQRVSLLTVNAILPHMFSTWLVPNMDPSPSRNAHPTARTGSITLPDVGGRPVSSSLSPKDRPSEGRPWARELPTLGAEAPQGTRPDAAPLTVAPVQSERE